MSVSAYVSFGIDVISSVKHYTGFDMSKSTNVLNTCSNAVWTAPVNFYSPLAEGMQWGDNNNNNFNTTIAK